MKNLLLTVFCFVLIGCETKEEISERRKLYNENTIERIQREIIYFKDERTGICFAYIWGGSENGGPAITIVPEEKVKDYLVK